MTEKTLEKLNKLLEITKDDTITPKELEKFIQGVLLFIKQQKDEIINASNSDRELIKEVTDFLPQINAKSEQLDNGISEVFKLLEEVKSIRLEKGEKGDAGERGNDGENGKDGKDADEKEIIAKLKKEIPKEITGESVVDKINSLSLEEENKIDASHIKNLPQQTTGGGGVRQLEMLNDVDLTGLTKNSKGEYILGSGSSTGLQSVIAGTNISVDNTDPENPVISSLSDRYKTNSTTSQAIVSTGTLTFTVDANLAYTSQQDVMIVYDASNHMHGQVVSYSGTSLVVDITHKTGSGTYNGWAINLDGLPVTSSTSWGSITGTLSTQTDLQNALNDKVDKNSGITGATKTKITYDVKGLVTSGADATTADINDSTNRRYVTDAQLTVIGNTSGTNTGDVTATDSSEIDFTLTGQNITASIVAGSIDETKLDASVNASLDLADSASQPGHTHTIANVTGLQTALDNKIDDSQVSAFGLTLIDDANAAAARTTLGLGTLATQSGTFSGTSSGTNTGDQTITLTGEATGSGTGSFAVTLTNSAVIGKVLTGFTVGARTAILATDTILQAFNKVQKYFNDLSALAFSGSASDLTGTKTSSFISDFTSAVNALITGKQDTLVSGTNIKTVNGNSLVGSGDVTISGGSIATKDEGTTLTSSTSSLNFTGAGVTATNTGGDVTINIPGGGGGGSYTFSGGTTETAGTVTLGGTLGADRTLTSAGSKLIISGASNNSDLRLSAIANSGLSGVALYKVVTGGSYLRGAMVYDASGNLYISEAGANGIRKVTPTGTMTTWVNPGAPTDGLAIDSAGNIYAGAQNSGNIYKITPAGSVSTFATLSGVTSVWGITIDSKNNIFALGYNNGNIYKVTPSGSQSVFATGFTYGHDLAADSKGNIYCATYTNSIVKVGVNGGSGSNFATGLSNPSALFIDSSDNIYCGDANTGLISIFNTSGVKQDIITMGVSIQGIIVSPTGDIIASDCVASNGSSIYNISQTQAKIIKTDSNGDVVKSTTGEQTGIKGVPKLVLPVDGVQFSDTFFKFPSQDERSVEWNTTTATAGVWEGTVGQGAGTYSTALPTTTNLYTARKRARWANAVTTMNQVLGQRNTEALFFRGSSAGQGGFFFSTIFGFDAYTAGSRLFAGLHTATTVVSAEPSASLNICGFGMDSTDSSVYFMSNDGTGTATKTAISGQPTVASNQGYRAYIYCQPNDSAIYYRLDNLNTGTVIVNSKITSDLPTATTMLTAGVLASNAALTTATATQLGVSKIYIA